MRKYSVIVILISLVLGSLATVVSYGFTESLQQINPNDGAVCETFTSQCGYCAERDQAKDGIYSRGWPFKAQVKYVRCGMAFSPPRDWQPLIEDIALFSLIFALPQIIYLGRKDYAHNRD